MGLTLETMKAYGPPRTAELEQRIEELEDLVRRLCKHTGMRMETLKELHRDQQTLIPRKQRTLE